MFFLNIKLKFTYYFSDLIRNVSILNFFILSSYIFTSGKHRYKLDAKKYLNRTRTELYWVECIFMKLVDTNCIWVNRRSPRKYVSYPICYFVTNKIRLNYESIYTYEHFSEYYVTNDWNVELKKIIYIYIALITNQTEETSENLFCIY